MSVLVVVATAAEAEFVPERFRTLITGFGKTAAAVTTTLGIVEERPSHVVNVGSAGALRDGTVGLLEVGTVVNHDINGDAVRALGYDPMDRLRVGDSEVVLASGDLFVADPEVRARLAQQADLVDMEAYGVAYAAQRLAVPVSVVKHVSDNADDNAFDWVDAVSVSARAVGDWLEEHFA